MDPDVLGLFLKARICKTFPAYTFESLDSADATEILQALQLLDIAAKMQQ